MPQSKTRKKKNEPTRYVWVKTTYFGREYRLKASAKAHKKIGMLQSARDALQKYVDDFDKVNYPQDYVDLEKSIEWGERKRAEGEVVSNADFARELAQELQFSMPGVEHAPDIQEMLRDEHRTS